jgi:uncharacterized membrane protein
MSLRRPEILASLVLAAALAAAPAVAHDEAQGQAKSAKGKEKCFGVAKAGENGCQSQNGVHTCGGCSKEDYSGANWKWVPMGTCQSMGGKLQAFEGRGQVAGVSPTSKQP